MSDQSVGERIIELLNEQDWYERETEAYRNRFAEAVAAERERCAKIAEEFAAQVASVNPEVVSELDSQEGLTYTTGYFIAAERIAARIREGS